MGREAAGRAPLLHHHHLRRGGAERMNRWLELVARAGGRLIRASLSPPPSPSRLRFLFPPPTPPRAAAAAAAASARLLDCFGYCDAGQRLVPSGASRGGAGRGPVVGGVRGGAGCARSVRASLLTRADGDGCCRAPASLLRDCVKRRAGSRAADAHVRG
ncbi:hypothetical protein ZWY2020_022113 [Hordeum vulgare]|nr:hypothetical protein ZWY2020_022113 [Hordeum vulgare]